MGRGGPSGLEATAAVLALVACLATMPAGPAQGQGHAVEACRDRSGALVPCDSGPGERPEPSGERWRRPAGSVDCGWSGYCDPGRRCTARTTCAPADSTDCGDGICGAGQKCVRRSDARHGCIPWDAVLCGTHYCDAGNTCSRGGGCRPAGSVDCGGGNYCQPYERCACAFDRVSALVAAGRYDEAEAAAKEEVRRNPDRADDHELLAWVYAKKGDWRLTLAQRRIVYRLRPEAAALEALNDATSLVAGDLVDGGRFVEAIALEKDILALAPHDPNIKARLERHLRLYYEDAKKRGDLKAQARAAEEGVKYFPTYADFRLKLGAMLLRQGNVAAAKAAYAEAMRLDPLWGLELGAMWLARGDHAEAERAYRIALVYNEARNAEISEIAANHALIARVRSRAGDAAGALAEYETAIRLAPQEGALHANLADFHFRQGDLSKARAALARARALGDTSALTAAVEAKLNAAAANAPAAAPGKARAQPLRVSQDWTTTEQRVLQWQALERLVGGIPDAANKTPVGRALKSWVGANTLLERGGGPLGISANGERLNLNEAFWNNTDTKQMNLFTLEAGKTIWRRFGGNTDRERKSPELEKFREIVKLYPGAMSPQNLRLARYGGEDFGDYHVADLDGASQFGYAVRVAVLNLGPPPGTTEAERSNWRAARKKMQEYLIDVLQ